VELQQYKEDRKSVLGDFSARLGREVAVAGGNNFGRHSLEHRSESLGILHHDLYRQLAALTGNGNKQARHGDGAAGQGCCKKPVLY